MSLAPFHVVIVGGGISGLSTAFFLMEDAKRHHLPIECTLVERDARWGGKILTDTTQELLIEGGPDSFLTSKPGAIELCRTLGLEDRLISTNAENNRTFSLCRGVLRELPQGLLSFRPQRIDTLVSGGLLTWWGLLRMGAERFWPQSSVDGSDETLGRFFRRRFGREAFDYLIEPLVAGIYAGDADQLSLEATFPRFRELEQQYGSVIKGMRAVQVKSKGNQQSSRPSSLFMTLRNGLGELVQALMQRLADHRVRLMMGSGCGEIQNSGKNDGRFSVILEDQTMLSADAVVLTTPTFQSAQMISSFQPEAARLLEQIPYVSTATISMAYPTAAVDGHIKGFGFVVPRKEQRSLLAGTWTSLKWPYRSQKGTMLIRCYMGGWGREHALDMDDKHLIEAARQELETIVGITAPPHYAEVYRWVRGMPQYVVGHQSRVNQIRHLLSPWPRLQISGAGLYGIGIPDCITQSRRVAECLMQSFSPQSIASSS